MFPLKYPIKNSIVPSTPRTASTGLDEFGDEFVAELMSKEALLNAMRAKQYGVLTYLDPSKYFKDEPKQRSTRPNVKVFKNILLNTVGSNNPSRSRRDEDDDDYRDNRRSRRRDDDDDIGPKPRIKRGRGSSFSAHMDEDAGPRSEGPRHSRSPSRSPSPPAPSSPSSSSRRSPPSSPMIGPRPANTKKHPHVINDSDDASPPETSPDRKRAKKSDTKKTDEKHSSDDESPPDQKRTKKTDTKHSSDDESPPAEKKHKKHKKKKHRDEKKKEKRKREEKRDHKKSKKHKHKSRDESDDG